jgi:transposase
MSRSAAGTQETPGNNVKAKSGLNKSILDQGWFEFRRQLAYKLAWNGGYLIAVPPQNTSRTCPACGHVSADNRPSQARFECVKCGFAEHADVVGAINILSRGMRLLREEGLFPQCQPGWPVDRTAQAVGSRNPPKRIRRGSMPRLGAVGISGLQAGEDVNRTAAKSRVM